MRSALAILILSSVAAAWLGLGAGCGDDSATGGGGSATTGATGGAGVGGNGGASAVTVTPAPYGAPFELLSEWHLFGDIEAQQPAARVVPYEVNSPLFTDYAAKWRFLYLPEGTTIAYDDLGRWEFPLGSILVKTFGYPDDPAQPSGSRRLMETRLLYKEPDGWTPHTYIYESPELGAQSDAKRQVAGKFVPVEIHKPSGQILSSNYHVPNTNECKDCHTNADVIIQLGPRTRQLDMDHDYGQGMVNQIDHLFSLGYLDKAPLPAAERVRLVNPFTATSEPLDYRVRSYFDANCAHCHTSGGFASQSALLLDLEATDPATKPPANWGVCKIPTSAGGESCGTTFDVVPGAPAESLLVCRLESTDLEARMPPLGTAVIDDEAVALVSQWIAAMPAQTCQ